ncbi:MAG: hypothetical protein LBU73_08870 [Helicobacteraceae bacterium]|nr:hypothetical protein [Helicobacteraceae bacterium]
MRGYLSKRSNKIKKYHEFLYKFLAKGDTTELDIFLPQNGLDIEERDAEHTKEEILDYVLEYIPDLRRFAVDYFNCYEEHKKEELQELKKKYGKAFAANKKELKEKYGKTFAANEKSLFALIRELAPSYEWSK